MLQIGRRHKNMSYIKISLCTFSHFTDCFLALFVLQHIKKQMTQLGWHLQYDTFVDNTPYGPKTFTNIVAIQSPLALRRLTLACHFDSKYFDQFEFIGATDSAVPCALLIDIARHLNSAFQSVRTSSLFSELAYLAVYRIY